MNPAIWPDTSAVVNIFAVRGKAYVSKEPPRLAAEELERIRILFLGHHARPSAVAIISHRERGEKGTDAYLAPDCGLRFSLSAKCSQGEAYACKKTNLFGVAPEQSDIILEKCQGGALVVKTSIEVLRRDMGTGQLYDASISGC